jgi:hypothetical protein
MFRLQTACSRRIRFGEEGQIRWLLILCIVMENEEDCNGIVF